LFFLNDKDYWKWFCYFNCWGIVISIGRSFWCSVKFIIIIIILILIWTKNQKTRARTSHSLEKPSGTARQTSRERRTLDRRQFAAENLCETAPTAGRRSHATPGHWHGRSPQQHARTTRYVPQHPRLSVVSHVVFVAVDVDYDPQSAPLESLPSALRQKLLSEVRIVLVVWHLLHTQSCVCLDRCNFESRWRRWQTTVGHGCASVGRVQTSWTCWSTAVACHANRMFFEFFFVFLQFQVIFF